MPKFIILATFSLIFNFIPHRASAETLQRDLSPKAILIDNIDSRAIVDAVFIMREGSEYQVAYLYPPSKLKDLLDNHPNVSAQTLSEGLYALAHWNAGFDGFEYFNLLISRGAKQIPAPEYAHDWNDNRENNLTTYIERLDSNTRPEDPKDRRTDENLLKMIKLLGAEGGSPIEPRVIDDLVKDSLLQSIGPDYPFFDSFDPQYEKIKSLDWALSRYTSTNPFANLIFQESQYGLFSDQITALLMSHGYQPTDAQDSLNSAFLGRVLDYRDRLDQKFIELGANINSITGRCPSCSNFNALMLLLQSYPRGPTPSNPSDPKRDAAILKKIQYYVEHGIDVNYRIEYANSAVRYLGVYTFAHGTPFESYLMDHGMLPLPN